MHAPETNKRYQRSPTPEWTYLQPLLSSADLPLNGVNGQSKTEEHTCVVFQYPCHQQIVLCVIVSKYNFLFGRMSDDYQSEAAEHATNQPVFVYELLFKTPQ